jgi:CBS-domain-containing membrane protein
MAQLTTGHGGWHDRALRRAGQAGVGFYAFLLCVLVVVLAGLVGLAVHQPWLFPSLGPTLMMFFEQPTSASSRPRDALIGHAVAIVAGLLALEAFGLRTHPSAVQEGLTGARVAAAALSLGLTTLVLALLRSPHPPAGATTLIVSLGILTTTVQLGTMALAVTFTVAAGLLLNRLLGVRQPCW